MVIILCINRCYVNIICFKMSVNQDRTVAVFRPMTCFLRKAENTMNSAISMKFVQAVLLLLVYWVNDIAKADLVAYWPLDNPHGVAIEDRIGNHNGTINGNPDWTKGRFVGTPHGKGADNAVSIPSKFGIVAMAQERKAEAPELDGIDDYISISSLNLDTNTVTISAWLKRHGDQAKAGIVFSRDGSTNAGLSFISGNRLRYTWNNNSSKTYGWDSGLIVPNSQWVHVVLVVEPHKATLYLNQNGEITSATNSLEHSAERFGGVTCIGLDPDKSGGSRFFKGLIDEVAIFDHALTAKEIEQLADNGIVVEPVVQKYRNQIRVAQELIKEKKYDKAISLLENQIAEYKQWSRQNSHNIRISHKFLASDLHFLLAKTKEEAISPTRDVIASYEQVLSPPLRPSHLVSALVWLAGNLPENIYISVVKKLFENHTEILEDARQISKFFELRGDWNAFKFYLDAGVSSVPNISSFAGSTAAGLLKNGTYAKKFWAYCQANPACTEYVIKILAIQAQDEIQQEKFMQAYEIYQILLHRYGDFIGNKTLYEFKLAQCLFQEGNYAQAISELDNFIQNYKSTNRNLVKQAMLMKGQSYIQLNDFNRAFDVFLTLMIDYPETKQAPEAHFYIGYCNLLQKNIGMPEMF